jgi:hypothetical protein
MATVLLVDGVSPSLCHVYAMLTFSGRDSSQEEQEGQGMRWIR